MKITLKDLKKLIRESQGIKSIISEELEYHISNNIPAHKNIFRPGSDSYFSIFCEVRTLYGKGKYDLSKDEEFYIKETSIVTIENELPLDFPMINEAEFDGRDVDLNKPARGGRKKFFVYVKDPKTGKIKKVEWGDPSMKVRISDPEARKSFAARHNCDDKDDKTKPGYWACRTGRYPYLTGSSKKYKWW